MDPNPPDFTEPREARNEEGAGTIPAGTILTPDPSVGTGHVLSLDVFSPANIQTMRDALAAIDGYSFRAAYGTPSEEPEPEPTLLPPGHIKPPTGYSGPPMGWSPSTLDAPVR